MSAVLSLLLLIGGVDDGLEVIGAVAGGAALGAAGVGFVRRRSASRGRGARNASDLPGDPDEPWPG